MPQQTVRYRRALATVNGAPTRVFGADTQHGVDQPIGTASITLPLPLPAHLLGPGERLLNAPLTIQAGFDDTGIDTIFTGRIDRDRFEMDARSRTATLHALGNATLLDWEEEHDLVFAGPIPLYEIVRSLCQWRRVPSYRIDPITYYDGITDVVLGGNELVDDGQVIIPRRTSPLQWLTDALGLWDYRIFDTPQGTIRVQRIGGEPPETADAPLYAEGVNCYRLERSRDLKPMVTYWTVEGASWTDKDGVPVKVRSVAASVDPDPLLTPPGYRAKRISNSLLVFNGLAQSVRLGAELNHSRPYVEASWETTGTPFLAPGDVVETRSETFGTGGRRFLTSLRQVISETSYTATMNAWAGGNGRPLYKGEDEKRIFLRTDPVHLGDTVLSNYAVERPSGAVFTIPFDVPDEYTAIIFTAHMHGANSELVDGVPTDLRLSKIAVWQNGEEVGAKDLPVTPEEGHDYRQIRYWRSIRMPVPGQLKAGRAEIRITAGGKDEEGADLDDFEMRDIAVVLSGIGRPTLPRVGVN